MDSKFLDRFFSSCFTPLKSHLMFKMSNYVADLPSFSIDSDIPTFFEKFYAVSDNPSAHEDYAQSFTNNARFIMGTKEADGHDQILELRKGLWGGPVKTRKHTVKKIFPFGIIAMELSMHVQTLIMYLR
jgi:hypothetical protein